MPQNNKFKLTIVTFLILLISRFGFCEGDFVIFHTSDMHGRISCFEDPTSKIQPRPLVGGFAVMQTYLQREKLKELHAGNLPILLDSGDYFQGTPVVDETKGECMIDMMNMMKYTAAAIGNHDFDYGADRLRQLSKKARFFLLGANLVELKTNTTPSFVRSSIRISFKGKTLGVIGILTPEMKKICFEHNINGFEFLDPVPIVNSIAQNLRQNGANIVILLSHMGIIADRAIAPKLKNVDLILGGHSHTSLEQPEYPVPNGPAIIHSGYDSKYISKVRISLANGKPNISSSLIYLDSKHFPEDPTIKSQTDKYEQAIKQKLSKVIGTSSVDLFRGIAGGDSPEGSFVADAIREAGKSDFAFMNLGGIRAPILKGPITLESVFCLQPFSNVVEVLTMTGSEIRHLIEKTISVPFKPAAGTDDNYAISNPNIKVSGLKRDFQSKYGYLVPSNLKVTFDPELPSMNRVIEILDGNGKPLIDTKEYTVSFSDFLAAGGDGFTYLKEIKKRRKTPILVREAIINKIIKDGGIHKLPEPRMINKKLFVTAE